MKKVAILIPVHCAPKVFMTTLGTWLETYDGSYDAEVVICVHENYHHYHDGLPSIRELPGIRGITVKELNWNAPMGKWEFVQRYSTMHSLSLKTLLRYVHTRNFSHVALLDHDLVFKQDFIKWSIEQPADLVGGYMDDRNVPAPVKTNHGVMVFAPKFSIWHLVMSARFYAYIMADVDLICPTVRDQWFYDTFSQVIEKNQLYWHLPVCEMKAAEIERMVQHLWSMSFNFGQDLYGVQKYWQRLADCESAFDKRFPNGIKHLMEKLKR